MKKLMATIDTDKAYILGDNTRSYTLLRIRKGRFSGVYLYYDNADFKLLCSDHDIFRIMKLEDSANEGEIEPVTDPERKEAVIKKIRKYVKRGTLPPPAFGAAIEGIKNGVPYSAD